MRKLKIGDIEITDDGDPFVISELGSNHQGSLSTAKEMIEISAKSGVNAVKLQKRHNEIMFTKQMLESPYNNEFSMGATYGEHRAKLDWFGEREFRELQAIAEKNGILLFATPFEEKSADFLERLNMPLYKIASCDVQNVPLVRHVAAFGKPMLISIGGASEDDIDRVCGTVKEYHGKFALMHCVATYPNRDEDLNLAYIRRLRERYPDILIGFSSHHSGMDPVKEAYHMGARIFEVHFTLNRGFRGTDHGFSMEPKGLANLCEDLRRIKTRLGRGERVVLDAEKNGFIRKMGKAVHVARAIPAGKTIEPEDIAIKAPADGIPPFMRDQVIGRITTCDLSTVDVLTWEKLR